MQLTMNNDIKYSIDELAQKVNDSIDLSDSADNRQIKSLSVRRIQDYMTKGLLDKPYGSGKNKWFGDLHFKRLVALRTLQAEGMSDRALSKVSNTAPIVAEENALQQDALALLSTMGNTNNSSISVQNITGASSCVNSSVNNTSATALTLSRHYATTAIGAKGENYSTISRPISKNWIEYPIDTEGKVFLKIESGTEFKDTQSMLEQIKSILNIGE